MLRKNRIHKLTQDITRELMSGKDKNFAHDLEELIKEHVQNRVAKHNSNTEPEKEDDITVFIGDDENIVEFAQDAFKKALKHNSWYYFVE